MESSNKEISDRLDNTIKIIILDSIDKLVATNIDKDVLADSVLQLITLNVLVNKKTLNGYGI